MMENDVVPIFKLVAEHAIDLDGYLAKYGVKDSSSGWCIDKLRGNRQLRTTRGRKRCQPPRPTVNALEVGACKNSD